MKGKSIVKTKEHSSVLQIDRASFSAKVIEKCAILDGSQADVVQVANRYCSSDRIHDALALEDLKQKHFPSILHVKIVISMEDSSSTVSHMIGICVKLEDNLLRFVSCCAVGTAFHTKVVMEIILADEMSLIYGQGIISEIESEDPKLLCILVDIRTIRKVEHIFERVILRVAR